MDHDEAAKVLGEFVAVVQALRTPGTGCPWDLEQDHRSLRPYLLEEACEVLDAIDSGSDDSLREELGDLLLQVVLHAQVASDRGAFSITDVARTIRDKMVRRHPHVFGSTRVSSAEEVSRNWEQIKAAEKGGRALADSLPSHLPALQRAQRLGQRAAKVRPDLQAPADALAEVRAALGRLEGGMEGGSSLEQERNLGDVLFEVCQLARRLGLSAEDSLRDRNRRFADGLHSPQESGG